MPSYNTADEAAQPDAPVQPADATGDSTADTAHTHDIGEATLWIIIIVVALAIVGVIVLVIMQFRKGSNGDSGGNAVALEQGEDDDNQGMWGGRKQRFSNLRY